MVNRRIILKPGREKSILNRHPWIFSGAVAGIEGDPGPGDTVDILSHRKVLVGRGAFSPRSQIVCRVWSFCPDEEIGPDFFCRSIRNSVSRRNFLHPFESHSACRLVYAESDHLPGIIVDRYADFLVCQFLSSGAERWKGLMVEILAQEVSCRGIYERSDTPAREKEGLAPAAGVLFGQAPPDFIRIREEDIRFDVDVRNGHKTGFYLDQRDNRRRLSRYVAGKELLNCFCYTGGFGITALAAGADHVTQVDTSAEALDMAAHHADINSLDPTRMDYIQADVFQLLRKYRDSRKQFDVIVLDPPKFAESMSQVEKAARGYKDINLLAMKLLRPGGILATFSCSGRIGPELFQKIVADAATDAGRFGQVLGWLHQGADHPVDLSFPEGLYLKGLICRMD